MINEYEVGSSASYDSSLTLHKQIKWLFTFIIRYTVTFVNYEV